MGSVLVAILIPCTKFDGGPCVVRPRYTPGLGNTPRPQRGQPPPTDPQAPATTLNAAAAEAPNDTDAEYLRASAWPEVVAIAGRLAQVMVANDLGELAALLEEAVAPDPCQIVQGTTGNSGEQAGGDSGSDTASPQVGSATSRKRP